MMSTANGQMKASVAPTGEEVEPAVVAKDDEG